MSIVLPGELAKDRELNGVKVGVVCAFFLFPHVFPSTSQDMQVGRLFGHYKLHRV